MSGTWNDDFKQGYRQGYNAGSHKSWPLHLPPSPPDEIIAEFMAAARSLRDSYDTVCATFPKNDDLVLELEPKIDRLDDAFEKIGKWLTSKLIR